MKSNKINLKWKVILYFILFSLIIYLVFWFFQVVMINFFFRNMKINNAEESLNRLVLEAETHHNIDIMIDYPTFEKLTEYLDEKECDGWILYRKPQDTHLQIWYSSTGNQIDEEEIVNYWNTYQTRREFVVGLSKESNNYIIGKFIEKPNNISMMILIESKLVPFESTVQVLSNQFIVISGFIVILAVIFSAVMCNRIVKPITSLTKSAKEFAKGKYDTKFSGYGYDEIDELSNALNYASSELSKLDLYQKELMANVSHDLRTPLTLITGYGEMLIDYPEERTEENLKIIVDEGKRLTGLVNDILALTKIETNAIELELDVYNLTENIKEIVSRQEKLIENLNIKIQFEYDQQAYIKADCDQFAKVIYNFLSNAINYVGDDHLVIVKQNVTDKYVTISVIDHGVGIPKEEIDNIWYRYYKAKTHKRASVGSGLGLAIVRSILDKHGFEYGVISELNEGSEFWVKIPLSDK